jgi:hypothetical protein
MRDKEWRDLLRLDEATREVKDDGKGKDGVEQDEYYRKRDEQKS